MSKLLITVDHQFSRTPDGKVWVKTIYGYDFWKRYLRVFDRVRIACRISDVSAVDKQMLLSSGEGVEFYQLPQYRGPKEFALRYFKIRKQMCNVTDSCDCALFRIPSPIAGGVKAKAQQNSLPWAVEVVNDPWDTFAPGSYKSIFRPVVRVFFTHQVKSMAKNADGASYVTKEALQRRYPPAARLGKRSNCFEGHYSSIILKKDYFCSEHHLPNKTYTIVHVNSCVTDYSKGHDVVIRCVKLMREHGLDVKARFIGDGPARQDFEKYAAEIGVADYIEFIGLLSKPEDVRGELINADIMIFPTKGEGLPRTVIEAMAVGLPCLSTPVNGIPELLESDYLFEQQDDISFAEKAIEILLSPALYQKISQRNIQAAKEYENDILTKNRDEFYVRLLRKAKKE